MPKKTPTTPKKKPPRRSASKRLVQRIALWQGEAAPKGFSEAVTQCRQRLESMGYQVVSLDHAVSEGSPTPDTVDCLVVATDGVRFADGPKSLPARWQAMPVFFWNVGAQGARARFSGGAAVLHQSASDAEIHQKLELGRELSRRWQQALTEQKNNAVELAKLDTALKQREEFLGVCAHDLRSPLGLIKSSIGLLLNQGGSNLDGFQQELLKRAHRQATHALALVADLLDVVTLDQGLKPRYELLPLDHLLSEFASDYGFEAKQKNIRLHYNNPVPDWRILADPERVRQLLQNLFSNALKFTDSGKNIYLETIPFQGRRKTDPPYPMIVIGVKDEGRGIPPEEVQKIFDRFKQLKDASRGEGRGLGLSVAKQISTLHDGNVWVESEPGKGSTFFALFAHVVSRATPVTPTAVDGSRKMALIAAEPEGVLSKQLEAWGWEVVMARDGVEAITYAYHYWPDVILLPPTLKKLDAPEVTRILKGDPLGRTLPLILVQEPHKMPGQDPKEDSLLVEGSLPMPFSRKQFEACLETARQRTQPHQTPALAQGTGRNSGEAA